MAHYIMGDNHGTIVTAVVDKKCRHCEKELDITAGMTEEEVIRRNPECFSQKGFLGIAQRGTYF